MPPVSTPSSASAGPGSAIAVSATWRRPSTAAAACRAARAASARPGTGVPTGGAGQSSDIGATVPNSRASAPDAASARPRRMAASARAIASDASEPYSMPSSGQQAGEIGHADRKPRCRGRAQGQRGDRGLHRLGERGRIEAAGGIVERGEVQHEARHARRLPLPDRRGRRAMAQQQHPVQPLGQRHLQPGAQRPLGHRTDPGIGRRGQRHRPLAGRQAGQRRRRRIVPGGRQRHQPRRRIGIGAHRHAAHPHALPGPGGLHARHARRAAATRKAYFAVHSATATTKSCG